MHKLVSMKGILCLVKGYQMHKLVSIKDIQCLVKDH